GGLNDEEVRMPLLAARVPVEIAEGSPESTSLLLPEQIAKQEAPGPGGRSVRTQALDEIASTDAQMQVSVESRTDDGLPRRYLCREGDERSMPDRSRLDLEVLVHRLFGRDEHDLFFRSTTSSYRLDER